MELFEKEVYECVCQECSKTFESEDLNAEICVDCWERLIGANLENEGE